VTEHVTSGLDFMQTSLSKVTLVSFTTWVFPHPGSSIHCDLHLYKLEMLARLRAGQRDGRRRQADDDFGGWVNDGPILAPFSR